jgi:GNAT superfamily N-acetyltransferase
MSRFIAVTPYEVKREPASLVAMEPKVSIRRAAANDTDAVAAVFSAAFKGMNFVPKLHSDEEDRAFVRGFIADGESWIATHERHPIGLACIEGDWLSHLYVHPMFQNRGAGTLLLDRVKAERPGGFQFWAFQANVGARRFYERHGCVAVEFTDGRRNEEKTPDVRYEWRG